MITRLAKTIVRNPLRVMAIFLFLSLIVTFIAVTMTLWFYSSGTEITHKEAPKSVIEDNIKTPTLVLMPLLGLANRLRTIKSFQASLSCTHLDRPGIQYLWPATHDLNASYYDVFSEPQLPLFDISNLKRKSFVVLTHHSASVTPELLSSWLHMDIETLNLHVDFSQNMNTLTDAVLIEYLKKYDIVILASAWGANIKGTTHLHRNACSKAEKDNLEKKLLQKFRPDKATNDAMLQTTLGKAIADAKKKRRIIGVHMRLEDMMTYLNYASKTASLEYTLQVLRGFIQPDDLIFLATDDKTNTVIKEFREVFGQDRIIFNTFKDKDRNSLQGIRNGVIDLWSLSSCDVIWSNALLSSYSKLAAELGEKELRYVLTPT